MASSWLRVALCLLPLSVFACAGSTDEASQGDDQNIKAGSKLGEAGTMCGGIAGLRCKAGLQCNAASHPDASGTCVDPKARPGEVGGLCGGIAGFSCKGGLRCDKTDQGFDVSGICVVDQGQPPIPTCMAMPACMPDEETAESCALKDPTCTTRAMCGRTINCKKKASSKEQTIEGTLHQIAGIGGETTGFAISSKFGSPTTPMFNQELVLDSKEQKAFVDGRFARVKGTMKTLHGVETGDRDALDVTDLLVCPAPGSSMNCMPPVEPDNRACGADRSWVQKNCKDVSFLD